jgi:DNA-directed RNA polymerase subunit RPC12/RpoP
MMVGKNEPCPKCKSRNIVQSIASMVFGARAELECRSCGHKWKE